MIPTSMKEKRRRQKRGKASYLFCFFFSIFWLVAACTGNWMLSTWRTSSFFLFLSKSSDVNSSNIVVAKGAEVKEFIARCRLILEIMMKSLENVVVV